MGWRYSVPLLVLERASIFGLSKESQFPLALKVVLLAAPSMHRLLGQGQSVQCKPLVQPSHSLIGMFSSAQTDDNSWESTGPQSGNGCLSWQQGFRDGPKPEDGEFGGLMVQISQYLSTDSQVLI